MMKRYEEHTIDEILTFDRIDKEKTFEGITYDVALPMKWLDKFIEIVKKQNSDSWKKITNKYWFIVVTTVWIYDDYGSLLGRPISICKEINDLIEKEEC